MIFRDILVGCVGMFLVAQNNFSWLHARPGPTPKPPKSAFVRANDHGLKTISFQKDWDPTLEILSPK